METKIFPGVFSKYAVKNVGFKVDGDDAYTVVDGAGTIEYNLEKRVVTKSKSNIVKKTIGGYTGEGDLTISCHLTYELKRKIHGYADTGVAGVVGLSTSVKTPTIEITVEVEDEDGDLGYIYFPCAVVTSLGESIDSNGDEVAEDETEFTLSADAYDMPVYEAVGDDLTGSAVTSDNWLENASSDLLNGAA